jgi:hypothetical protein
MAKHTILEAYTFTPSAAYTAGTIVVTGKALRQEQLLLITNVTTGVVIYNFSDPSLGGTITTTISSTTGQETTSIALEYNTLGMSSTDKLSILYDETYQEFIPSETYRDANDKLKTSQPQALIDTDFEYGTQPTKWESIHLFNNRPTWFYDVTVPLNITAIVSTGTTVTVTSTANPPVGSVIFIQGTLDVANADGWWLVDTTAAGNFTYKTIIAPSPGSGGSLFDPTKTYVFQSQYYTGAGIPTTSISLSGTAATITTTYAHGLQVGDTVFITGTTGATGTLNGTWYVYSTPQTNSFTVASTATGTVTLAAGANATVFPRPFGYVEHRAYDGGVQFSNVMPYHGYQVIRQTRRYFRYQSGKGIMFSTGSLLKPSINVDSLTSSGSVVTVNCKKQHGLATGAVVQVAGCAEPGYNGQFTVTSTPTAVQFTYNSISRLDATGVTPSTSSSQSKPIIVSPYTWYGSQNRLGMFDNQNGFYFEYDGQTLYVCKRNSTSQIAGVVSCTYGTQAVTGTGTAFSQDLKPGDQIVIRGIPYIVGTIASDTLLYILPEYRGSTVTNSIACVTTVTKVAQSQWNIDKCDGTGASKFNLDLTKMQMFFMDYSWYGAGAVRFGFKNNRGEVIYCHRMPNNNINYRAWMRSGNLPARYETSTVAPSTYLTQTLSSASGAGGNITVADSSRFPPSGTVVIAQPLAPGATGSYIEYINYSANNTTTNTLTIASRQVIAGATGPAGALGGGFGTAQTFSVVPSTVSTTYLPGGLAPVPVSLYAPSNASTLSHWGSSVIMDGRFDDDKSYVFNSGMATTIGGLVSGTRYALMSLRLAPSVDSGLVGPLGSREIVNRMQLTLRAMDAITTNAPCKIDLVLNGRVQGATGAAGYTFTNVGGSSLAQIAFHSTGATGSAQTIAGGENIYGFYTNTGQATSQDITQVRDLGNSIIAGGATGSPVPVGATGNYGLYPDGPDIITICATPVGATGFINARISWTEAQA